MNITIASAKRHIESLSDEDVLREFERTWTDLAQVARAIRKVMLDALEGDDTATLAIDQIARVCGVENWKSPGHVLAAVTELRARADDATAQLEASPVLSMADRSKLASLQTIEDRGRKYDEVVEQLAKVTAERDALVKQNPPKCTCGIPEPYQFSCPVHGAPDDRTRDADCCMLAELIGVAAGALGNANCQAADAALRRVAGRSWRGTSVSWPGGRARALHLQWDGTEWIDGRCGCRYHPDDDNGTHGGAPHVHLCEKHLAKRDEETDAQKVTRLWNEVQRDVAKMSPGEIREITERSRSNGPTADDIDQGLSELYGLGYRLKRNAAGSGWRLSNKEHPYQEPESNPSTLYHKTIADAIRHLLPSWNSSTWRSRRSGDGGPPHLGDG